MLNQNKVRKLSDMNQTMFKCQHKICVFSNPKQTHFYKQYSSVPMVWYHVAEQLYGFKLAKLNRGMTSLTCEV